MEEDVPDNSVVQNNSDVLNDFKNKLCHLSSSEQHQMTQLILEFTELFPDVPGIPTLVMLWVKVKLNQSWPVKAVVNYPIPSNKRELVEFLGMTGYYSKFC